jgi:hypothetical protein
MGKPLGNGRAWDEKGQSDAVGTDGFGGGAPCPGGGATADVRTRGADSGDGAVRPAAQAASMQTMVGSTRGWCLMPMNQARVRMNVNMRLRLLARDPSPVVRRTTGGRAALGRIDRARAATRGCRAERGGDQPHDRTRCLGAFGGRTHGRRHDGGRGHEADRGRRDALPAVRSRVGPGREEGAVERQGVARPAAQAPRPVPREIPLRPPRK